MNTIIDKIKTIGVQLSGVEKELSERGETPKYPLTTLPIFSKKIWGLKEGLTVIGARSSNGKSSIVAQIAMDLADQNIPTLFLSLEMTSEAIIERLFCNYAKINNYEIISGRFKHYLPQWGAFKQVMKDIPLMVTSGIGQSFQEVNFMVEQLNPKPKCIIVDYIQNIATKTKEGREMMNEYIRKFRELALVNKFVGILCSQVNRGATQDKTKEPALWYLKETGTLEEAADMVILMHYDYIYTNDENTVNDMKLIIAKSRNGRTGQHLIRYIPEHYRFEELEAEKEELKEEKPIIMDWEQMKELI